MGGRVGEVVSVQCSVLLLITDSLLLSPPRQSLRCEHRFLLEGRRRIADRQAFVEVLAKEGEDAALAFVLRGMDEFVGDEEAVVAEIAANVDAVAQREPGGVGG